MRHLVLLIGMLVGKKITMASAVNGGVNLPATSMATNSLWKSLLYMLRLHSRRRLYTLPNATVCLALELYVTTLQHYSLHWKMLLIKVWRSCHLYWVRHPSPWSGINNRKITFSSTNERHFLHYAFFGKSDATTAVECTKHNFNPRAPADHTLFQHALVAA